jgi:phosphoenolpyruvate-protein kinase (PTS system EI component)
MMRDKKKEFILKGIPASPGIAIGKAMLLSSLSAISKKTRSRMR